MSGGLGTACQGICEGLAAADVDVLFVIPKAFGDENAPRTQVVGANQVSWRETHTVTKSLPGVRYVRMQARETRSVVPGTAAEPDSERIEEDAPQSFVEGYWIDSALRPYQNRRTYHEHVETLPGERRSVRLPGGRATVDPQELDSEGWRSWCEALAHEAQMRTAEEHAVQEDFAGGYGGDLFGEVARYARVVAHLAAQEHFDLVHGHDWMTAPAALAAARTRGVPLVMHAHALERDRSGNKGDGRVAALERLGLVEADRVVCVSHYTAGIVHHDYGVPRDRLRVVHNAVTQKEQRREWHTHRRIKEPLVLFLGRVTMQKGPEYFLEAAAQVVKVRPDVTFVFSGSGDMLPRMIEYSARLGLARHVHFTGFLRGKDVERMYAQADVYVMPSVSEPFGIAPLEAMALDVPVILSSQSGVSEVVTHALKVDFWDTRELANKMLAILQYQPLRQDLIQSGREEVRRMRWEARGSLLRDVYQELLAPALH
ncbi:MAG: glycosyltransferase family 4 protein [Planctomycetota bacterium]